jgi:hypothetical protein
VALALVGVIAIIGGFILWAMVHGTRLTLRENPDGKRRARRGVARAFGICTLPVAVVFVAVGETSAAVGVVMLAAVVFAFTWLAFR